ncbi:MAG: class I SAM-dependent methyltransferase [Alphaproteobacteria bacterium]|nr:class I SAM-dependent methyltransferase [Alphaproteobacteria bacterium]
MPSMFVARDAANYERLMGRWSRRLAPAFIKHAGIAAGENILEVGCGTGSLTFALPEAADIASLTAIDHSEIYLAAAKTKNRDPRIRIEHGDGSALRFADASFDCAVSMLVLPAVVPRPEQAVAEMRRVTRPGGVVCAAFWDSPGGAVANRMFWDTAAVLDEAAAAARDRTMGRAIYAPGALPRIWAEAGLREIDERSLAIRMDFADFEDYWSPYASGEGMLGDYVASLDPGRRDRLERHLRSAYLCGRPDGPRSFVAVALSCRGVVPR